MVSHNHISSSLTILGHTHTLTQTRTHSHTHIDGEAVLLLSMTFPRDSQLLFVYRSFVSRSPTCSSRRLASHPRAWGTQPQALARLTCPINAHEKHYSIRMSFTPVASSLDWIGGWAFIRPRHNQIIGRRTVWRAR